MSIAHSGLKDYLVEQFNRHAKVPYLEEWIDGHTSFNLPSATYYIFDQWQLFAASRITL